MTKSAPSWTPVRHHLGHHCQMVGIDEVGRGAWAGPVVAAAVILPVTCIIEDLNDSKLLTPRKRSQLDRLIRQRALAIGVGWVAAAEVDGHGLSWAVRESGLRALAGLQQPFDHVILDGKHNYLDGIHQSETIVKGDSLVVPVAAASVIAKVARDRYLASLSRRHPAYGFEDHKGYGTARHRAAIAQAGPCSEHRLSYGPLQGSTHVTD